MTMRLPVLEELRIATPCHADWDEMRGDERVRFCGKCVKNVYDLSAMTRAEAEALAQAREGRMCVRLWRRADGTVITSDCPVGVRRARLRHRVWAALSGAAASAALAFALLGGRARADLAVDGKKPTTAVATAAQRPLMGKPALPREVQQRPKRPQRHGMRMMGEAAASEVVPAMGGISAAPAGQVVVAPPPPPPAKAVNPTQPTAAKKEGSRR